ncbi:MAG: ribose-phosphate pyrophosphokinase [Micavibrio sp.]|nr:MAG: ribose-phosphate pyrophosphokinase [Micavibrio sp.]
MKILSGTSNLPLAEAVSTYLGIGLTKVSIRKFADDEVFVEILENVRGEDVFVIQPTSKPANDYLMELLIMIDALRRGSARRITAVMPYYGYARQDRKTVSRSPITAKLVANILTKAGADRVLTMDLHAGQIQGFFDIPLDNLFAAGPVFLPAIKKRRSDHPLTIVSPDVGGVVRARAIANKLDAGLAIIDKRREKAGISEVMHVIGEVDGHDCIMVDDIVDSAGTLCNAAVALKAEGAASVRAFATHGVLSGQAVGRVEGSEIEELVITDSIRVRDDVAASKKIQVLSVASLIGEAMLRISEERSVSSLFEQNLPATA